MTRKVLATVLFLVAGAWLGFMYFKPEVVSPFEDWFMNQGFRISAALGMEFFAIGILVTASVLLVRRPRSWVDDAWWVL